MANGKQRHGRRPAVKKITVEPCPSPYSGPYGSKPLTYVGYLEGRHLHPRRLPTSSGERTVAMRLLDVSQETLDNIQNFSHALLRLQAGTLHLRKIPDSLVAHLVNLKTLDLSSNELMDNSFPDSMVDLQCLVEIRLGDNKLTKIPTCLKKLKNLSRLDLSNNMLESVTGIDRLRKMRVLVLDNNKIHTVIKDISVLKKLEILRCSKNKVRDITYEIRNLQALTDLDISHNKLTVINPEVFMLPKLEMLNASHNNINKIPFFNIKPQNRNWISCLDVSVNNLSKFPGHLLQMSHHLDISCNKIKVLSWRSIQKISRECEQELILKDNPLLYPPAAVCESGLRSVTRFFQEASIEAKVYQGIKILALGSEKSGKSSLVQSIVDQQAILTREIDSDRGGITAYETSFVYDVEDGPPNKSLQICIWDFNGNPFYRYPHYVFFEQSAITILTFNMSTYSDDRFYDMIGSWFDWMIAKNNKLVVLLVGTQSDLVPKERIQSICDSVCVQLTQHMQKRKKMIEERIRIIEQQSYISPTLSEQLKSYMFLLRSKFTVQSNIIVTSSAKFEGFKTLMSAIETLSNDKKLFPNVMRVIPTFWVDVETYLEEKGNDMAVPLMSWNDFKEDVTSKFGMKHLLQDITQYLHETGKVIWFSKVKDLKNYVIFRPAWIFEILNIVYHHDIQKNFSQCREGMMNFSGVNHVKLERMKRDYLQEGILDKDLLKMMLSSVFACPDNPSAAQMREILDILINGFKIGYRVHKRPKSTSLTFTVDESSEENDNEKHRKCLQFLIPLLRKTSNETLEIADKWKSIAHRRSLAVRYVFPRYLPPGVFEVFSIRAHEERFNLIYLTQWHFGVHAICRGHPVRLVFTCHQQDNDSNLIKFEMRDDTEGEDEVPAATMWTLLLPLLVDLDELLKEYAGVWVERFVDCPQCHESTFPGEWMTPKETQALPTKPCAGCLENIDTALLVQPRVKNKVTMKRLVKR